MADEELIDHIIIDVLSQNVINLDKYRRLLFPNELHRIIDLNARISYPARIVENAPRAYSNCIIHIWTSDYTCLMDKYSVTLSYNLCKQLLKRLIYFRIDTGKYPIDSIVMNDMLQKKYINADFVNNLGDTLIMDTQNISLANYVLPHVIDKLNNPYITCYYLERAINNGHSNDKIKWILDNIPDFKKSRYRIWETKVDMNVVRLMLQKGIDPLRITIDSRNIIEFILLQNNYRIMFDEIGLNTDYYINCDFDFIYWLIISHLYNNHKPYGKVIELDVNFNIKSKQNDSLLTKYMRCTTHNVVKCVRFMILHGVDINHHGYRKQTALSLAVRNYNYDIIGILLDNGADPNIPNKHGKYLIDILKRHNRKDSLRICHWICTKLNGLYFKALPSDLTRELRKYL
jgi:ankyrin repeat protein